MTNKIVLTACMVAVVAACSGAGPAGPLTDEGFAELKSNCSLTDARLVSANRSETTTTADGVEMTISYEDEDSDAVSIELSGVRNDGEMAQMILCVNQELERLDAEADVSLPEAQLGL